MNTEQLKERASNKIEAKLFYALKEVQELQMMEEGIINKFGVPHETVLRMLEAALLELDTLLYIENLINEDS